MSRVSALAAVVLVAAACGGAGGQPSSGSGSPTQAAVIPTDLGLPRCGKPPSPAPDPPPDGAVLPPSTLLTAVRDQPPLTQFNGYVELTPVQVRTWIEEETDLEILVSEDEGYESELLVTDGVYNTFVKARAICATASLLAEVIAPADSGATLPTPAGQATP